MAHDWRNTAYDGGGTLRPAAGQRWTRRARSREHRGPGATGQTGVRRQSEDGRDSSLKLSVLIRWSRQQMFLRFCIWHTHSRMRDGAGQSSFWRVQPGSGHLVTTWLEVSRSTASDDGLRHSPWPNVCFEATLSVWLWFELHDVFPPGNLKMTPRNDDGALRSFLDVTNTGSQTGDE